MYDRNISENMQQNENKQVQNPYSRLRNAHGYHADQKMHENPLDLHFWPMTLKFKRLLEVVEYACKISSS